MRITFFRQHLLSLLFIATLVLRSATQHTKCRDGSIGYASIQAIHNDIADDYDFALLQSSLERQSSPEYIYRLCPNTTFLFEADERLIPSLNNSIFQCGDSGSTSSYHNNCTFSGGQIQVLLLLTTWTNDDGLLHNAKMQVVEFRGVTFSGFAQAAIAGQANLTTTVLLKSVSFVVRINKLVLFLPKCPLSLSFLSFSLLLVSNGTTFSSLLAELRGASRRLPVK
jgi:hypothetical protein